MSKAETLDPRAVLLFREREERGSAGSSTGSSASSTAR